MSRRTHIAGFSLVELSIVLVILGLLVGGILSGQSLIRAAELRSVTTQYNNYTTAVSSFKDKYFALPGDMTNATQFWGLHTGSITTCATSASTDQTTCDGNGDGLIANSSCLSGTRRYETVRSWQQLANAGLVEGNYNGYDQAPLSKLSPAIWYLSSPGQINSMATQFDGDYGTSFQLSLPAYVALPCGTTLSPGISGTGVLTPAEAWNIDTKVDDGKPGTGKVRVQTPGGFNLCTDDAGNDSTLINSSYLLTVTDKNCGLLFTR